MLRRGAEAGGVSGLLYRVRERQLTPDADGCVRVLELRKALRPVLGEVVA